MFSRINNLTKILLIQLVRILLAATSLAPVVLVFGISKSESCQCLKYFLYSLTFFVILVFSCWAILEYFTKNRLSKDTDIKEVHRKDSDILSYLLIYLLPFIRSDTSVIASQPITTFACIFIILLVTANVGAFHVNPVLSILGFRVYSISTENSDGILIANSKDVKCHRFFRPEFSDS